MWSAPYSAPKWAIPVAGSHSGIRIGCKPPRGGRRHRTLKFLDNLCDNSVFLGLSRCDENICIASHVLLNLRGCHLCPALDDLLERIVYLVDPFRLMLNLGVFLIAEIV